MNPPEERPRSYRELRDSLAAARSRVWWRVFGLGMVRALGAAGAAFALALALVMLWPASWVGPVAAVATGLAILAAVAVLLAVPLHRVPSLARYTRAVDERYTAGERNEFLSALELGGAPARQGTSPGLIRALVDERAEAARRLDLLAPGRAPLGRRWAALPPAAGAILLVLGVLAPARFGAAVGELMRPRPPASVPVTIQVLTGNLRVERGADVVVRARVTGSSDVRPDLRVQRGAGVWRTFAAQVETEAALEKQAAVAGTVAGSVYRFTVPAVEAETRYRVAAGGAISPEYLIRVLEPLRIVSFQLDYRYPDYTGLEPETVKATDGAVAALRGTDVAVTIETNQPVRSGLLELAGGTMASLDLAEPTRGRATFRLDKETTYTVALERERRGSDPAAGTTRLGPYRVMPSPDREPLVAVLKPGEDTDVPADMRVALTVHAADDYGLSGIYLNYSAASGTVEDGSAVENGGAPARQRLGHLTGYPREVTETYDWDLSALKLLPGDLVSYYVEVYDNDTVSGPKSARSRVYTLRIPTLAELYAEVGEEHKDASTDLAQVREESRELKQELERIAREMTKFPVADWEDKKEVAQAFERQQQIREKLEQLAESLGESLARLENQDLVDDEVVQKVSEIQRLMEQISDPDLQKAFKKLGEQLAQLDQNEVERALHDLTLTHEELLKNLERTIEMLRQVQLEEKMERAVKQAEEMAERQDEINQDLARLEEEKPEDAGDDKQKAGDDQQEAGDDKQKAGDDKQDASASDEELSRLHEEEQENLEDADELKRLLDELAQELAKMNEELAKELERLSQEEASDQSPMQANMQSAQKQMAGGNPKGAKKSGKKASESARSLLEQLRMQQQMMANAEMAELSEKLRAAAHELLKVSDDEEELIGADEGDPQRLAEDQLRLLEATRRVNQLIEEIARTSIMVGTEFAGLLGQPIRSMENATSSYERSNTASGRLHSFQALAQVNEVILQLMQTEQSMCQGGGSCSSMKRGLQQLMSLSGQQQQVNQGSRQLLSQSGGQRLSESGQARLSRLAAQQAAIQKGMEEVAQTLDSRKDILGDLGNIASEMEDVAEDLERQQLDDRVLSRQHEIMNRLLDAQHSIRKRDLGKERLSRTGEEVPRPELPAAVPEALLSQRERLEADILRGRSDAYPPSFRELVERYFRALVEAPAGGEGASSRAPN